MSTNWFNSNKNSNYIIILLSLLLHIALIAVVFLIKPLNKTPEKRKTFDLVELQMGKPQITQQPPPQQQSPKTNPPTAKKQAENNQPIKETVSQTITPRDSSHEIDSIEKTQHVSQISSNTSNPAETNNSSSRSTSQTTTTSTQAGSEIGTVDAGVLGIKPVKIYGPDPVYPTIAQDLGIAGTVKAVLTIDAYGIVKEVTIDKSPHKSMSEEVIRTLLKWKFKPVEYKGAHVIIKRFIQEVEFKEEN
jgi:TonB family protein